MAAKAGDRISLKPTARGGFKEKRKMPSRNHIGATTATLEDGVIVLRMPIISETSRKPSSSGKSILYANTFGPKIVRQLVGDELVPVEIDGEKLRVIASVFLPLPKKTEA